MYWHAMQITFAFHANCGLHILSSTRKSMLQFLLKLSLRVEATGGVVATVAQVLVFKRQRRRLKNVF